ncbi:Dipeptidase [Gryllus bimaculatus]|nr:Dipeptidase [Gryllus bimaculatus]
MTEHQFMRLQPIEPVPRLSALQQLPYSDSRLLSAYPGGHKSVYSSSIESGHFFSHVGHHIRNRCNCNSNCNCICLGSHRSTSPRPQRSPLPLPSPLLPPPPYSIPLASLAPQPPPPSPTSPSTSSSPHRPPPCPPDRPPPQSPDLGPLSRRSAAAVADCFRADPAALRKAAERREPATGRAGRGGAPKRPGVAACALGHDPPPRQRLVDKRVKPTPHLETCGDGGLLALLLRYLEGSHNDLPWNVRKFVHNQILTFNFTADLMKVDPWARSNWSHTDLPRLRRGMVGGQN